MGAIEPHTDKGGLRNVTNVRIVFLFAAVTASEESEDNVPFNPQTMHAGADLAAAALPLSADCKTARLICRSVVSAFMLSAHCRQAVYDWHCCTLSTSRDLTNKFGILSKTCGGCALLCDVLSVFSESFIWGLRRRVGSSDWQHVASEM